MTHQDIATIFAAAEAARKAGKTDEAEQLAHQILAAFSPQILRHRELSSSFLEREHNDETLHARTLHLLATIEQRRGNYPKTLEYLAEALEIYLSLGNEEGIADISGNMGLIHRELGDLDKALEYCQKALGWYKENGKKDDEANVTSNIGLIYRQLGEYAVALYYYGIALERHEELGMKTEGANVTTNMGVVYRILGEYSKALDCFGRALIIHEESGNRQFAANAIGNIGLVHANLGDYTKALEYFGNALGELESLNIKSDVARVLSNIGLAYKELGDSDKALEYFGRSIAIHEELGMKPDVARLTGNIGGIFADIGEYERALEYFERALAVYVESGMMYNIALLTLNIGTLYCRKDFAGYDMVKAEEYLLRAAAMNDELGTKVENASVFNVLSEVYEQQNRWKEAYEYSKKCFELQREIQSSGAKKQAQHFEYRRNIAEREARHEATRELLHKTLPASVAERLLRGETVADGFVSVSILFADIVGFTEFSVDKSPDEVVALLNKIFTGFDRVMNDCGCEKIKTMGDGYMAAAGAPVSCDDHAEKTARAAFGILDVIREINALSGTNLQMRVGLHCGAAMAGVVGEEKYLYDLWGDAVNTAARMEQYGEAGRVHCSEAFALQLHYMSQELGTENNNTSSVIRTSQHMTHLRGEMEIKGKGIMKTYFLEKQ